MTKNTGETETETTDTRVAGTAGPAVLLAFAAGRNSDYQRRSAHAVLESPGAESRRAIVFAACIASLFGKVLRFFARLPGRLRKSFLTCRLFLRNWR